MSFSACEHCVCSTHVVCIGVIETNTTTTGTTKIKFCFTSGGGIGVTCMSYV